MTTAIETIREAINEWQRSNENHVKGPGAFHGSLLDQERNPGSAGTALLDGTATYLENKSAAGDEGTIWVVFSFEDRCYRMSGYYDSYSSTDWYGWDSNLDLVEVKPVERVVISYEPVDA